MIPSRRALAGTNGIPTEAERAYVEVDTDGLGLYAWYKDARQVDFSSVRPRRVHWLDGCFWDVEGAFSKRESDRERDIVEAHRETSVLSAAAKNAQRHHLRTASGNKSRNGQARERGRG